MIRSAFIFLLPLLVFSCAQQEPQPDTLTGRIDSLISEDRYEEALDVLRGEDPQDPDVQLLKEKTHLNWGMNSMSTFDEGEMRTRMNRALMQFTEVLKLNPENAAARAQIEQIMGVYATMPDREPEAAVLDSLRSVGYSF